jgi:hypothetical protein
MSYDFIPRNRSAEPFSMGSFSWIVLLEAFGYLFPEISNGARYYTELNVDERFKTASIGDNSGFRVTAEEARIMARMAKNYVAIQRSLPEQPDIPFDTPPELRPWPRKIREDFVGKFDRFSKWAVTSGGFKIL